MGTLRTKETAEKLKQVQIEEAGRNFCILCEREPIKDFTYWKIMKNLFPYDKIAKVHDMIVLKRHAPDAEMTKEEKDEYEKIKNEYIHKTYEFIIEPTYLTKSLPAHAHFHMLIAKD